MNRAFPAQNITWKPASIFLHSSLGVLVRLSQARKYLQSDPKPFQKVLWNFKNFLFNWILCWLTHSLMPSAKCYLTMDVATGLISSLFDVASSWGLPFRQLQDVQCMHHGITFCFLCVTVVFTDNARCRFVIAQYGFPQTVHAFCPYFLYRVYTSYLYCSLFVALCIGRSIGLRLLCQHNFENIRSPISWE